jgi:preprotein translocase subunit SecF
MDLPNPYTGDYRRLLVAPALLVLISLAVIFFIFPLRQGIDFKGGIDITVLSPQSADVPALQAALRVGNYTVEKLESKPNPTGYVTLIEMERSELQVRADGAKSEYFVLSETTANAESDAALRNTSEAQEKYVASRVQLNAAASRLFNLTGNSSIDPASFNSTHTLDRAVISAFSDLSDRENQRLRNLVTAQIPNSTASFEEVTSSLSAKFLDKALMVALYSILLTSVVVFVIFRTMVTTLSVLTGAAADIIIALGAMSLLGIPLTLASFAALLMLVGFSLDTAILLAMRVLKHKDGTPASRAYDAMKTGLTMTLSALVAFSALFVLAYITHIVVYYEIAVVALAGLVADIFAAWAFTAVVHLHYKEEEDRKGGPAPSKPLASYIFKN